MKTPTPVNLQLMNSLLICDATQGKVFWRSKEGDAWWNGRFAGREAGRLGRLGYWIVRLHGREWKRSRLIWALYHQTDKVPQQLDHIDRDRSNDAIFNLRSTTSQLNARNRVLSTRNKSGYTGVSWAAADQKWRAALWVDKKLIFLGNHDTLEAAVEARKAGEALYWDDHI